MLAHEEIWAAIDKLATHNGLSPSGLARRSGLDPTTFNKSKRHAPDGRPRWPSTESISKILRATNTDVRDFFALSIPDSDMPPSLAVTAMGEASIGGAMATVPDGERITLPQQARMLAFPDRRYDPLYALSVVSDSMMPLYREGDVLFLAPKARVSTGDRVAVKLRGASAIEVRLLEETTEEGYTFNALHPDQSEMAVPTDEVEWMARIVFATQ
ncbi:MAG: helix-turn-helix transcriptional regulator [Acuticoccus sp.]